MTNKEVVLGFLQAADKGDSKTVEKLFGSKHQFHTTMSPVPMNAAQHLGMMQSFDTAFENKSHEVIDYIESGNKVVVRGAWHGTHTGEFNNIPASGKKVRLTFIMVLEIENNEIKNQWMEIDGMSFMMQIGAIPAQAAV